MTTNAIITKNYNDTVLTFRNDGWFNMTKAAKAFGKDVRDFLYATATQGYINALTKCGNFPQLMEAKRGNQGGTWAHPKLAIRFAQWLDDAFAVWCDTVIDDILRGKAEVVITKPETSEILAMPSSMLEAGKRWLAELERAEALKLENVELKEEVAVLTHEVNHFTVSEFQTAAGRYFSASQRSKITRYAAGYCLAQGLEITRKPMSYTSPTNGETYENMVKVYPREALEHGVILATN